jgi:superfamily II DNA or RNA helicase
VKLRPYQLEAADRAMALLYGGTIGGSPVRECDSTLLVMPTGTGKTVVFGELIRRTHTGRAIVLAHREELIFQAAAKVRAVSGKDVSIEMAELRSDEQSFLTRSPVVVSTIQTQSARMKRFRPDEFRLVIVDEAHHATAPSYRRVINHYTSGGAKVVGVTATPDRADKAALGDVFKSVAYDYELPAAIHDGWLVPLKVTTVAVGEMDLSAVSTTAGDLNGAELDAVMRAEGVLHGMARPILDLSAGRKTLVFASSVAHAERLSEILNRPEYWPGCARWICGKTPTDERRVTIADYAAGKFTVLVNVGVATEGFDEPTVAVVAMGRPTKSRALYAQMAGRGTRTLPGVVDGIDAPAERQAAIAASAKRSLEILDFVGNSGHHRLVSATDIIGGRHSEAVLTRAKRIAEAAGRAADVQETIDIAAREIEEERQRQRRATVSMSVSYRVSSHDPFAVLHITPRNMPNWTPGFPASDKQIALLNKFGVATEGIDKSKAHQLLGNLLGRVRAGKCSYKQAQVLARYGYSTDCTRQEASSLLDKLKANGWRRPPQAVTA